MRSEYLHSLTDLVPLGDYHSSQNTGTRYYLSNTPHVRFVNTSMHGVSDPFVEEAFRKVQFAPYIPVKEQQKPDPEFPTVKFPNPEEKGEPISDV
jgi:phosphomannomutase